MAEELENRPLQVFCNWDWDGTGEWEETEIKGRRETGRGLPDSQAGCGHGLSRERVLRASCSETKGRVEGGRLYKMCFVP